MRSPHPHPRIQRIDPAIALALPGVVAVATGRDLIQWTRPLSVGIEGVLPMTMTALPVDTVRFVGDPVAVVVAADRYLAEDPAEQVVAEYAPLPAVMDFAAAVAPGAPPVDDDLGVSADHLPLSPSRIMTWLQTSTSPGAERVYPLGTSGTP